MTVVTKVKGFAAAAGFAATLLAGGATYASAEEVTLTMAVPDWPLAFNRVNPEGWWGLLWFVIKLAVLAVGGQGGGVLTGWIEEVARAHGYAAQATSVAGVSQRTGATVYYVEMAPQPATGAMPVFSLQPAAGDVDIMITAEMMEAGRAIIRGFVTPDRTTLITSTHRALAVSEKMVPGDGIADSVAEAFVESPSQPAARPLQAPRRALKRCRSTPASLRQPQPSPFFAGGGVF